MVSCKFPVRGSALLAVGLLVLGLGWLLSLALPGGGMWQATAAPRFFVQEGELLSVNEALGARRLIADQDVQILFDERGDQLLIGKGVEGRQVEQRGGTRLFLLKKDGSGLRPVTDQLVQQAFMNRSGSKVYYLTAEDKQLYEAAADGKPGKLLKPKVLEAQLSPNEQQIVYHKLNADWQPGDYYERALGIEVHDLATGADKLIASQWDAFLPLWTPDGSRILFAAANEFGIVSEFSVKPDGSDRLQLTNIKQAEVTDQTIGYANETAKWSPDGHALVYEGDGEIWINVFSPDYRQLITAKKIGFGKYPRWSEDGKTLSAVVTAAADPRQSVVEMDRDGNLLP